MKLNYFLATLLIATLYSISGMAIAADDRPNIVLIISDDHAWTDYGFMGNNQVRTPNIDRLAAEGLTYRRGYVTSALCSPSLATLLTGLHPHQHGITGNDPARRQPREPWLERFFKNPMLPRLLADSGYLTMHTGKYWMRKPADAGFTDDMGDTDRHGGQALGIGRETMQPVYDAIDKAKKQDKPFFLWYAPMMPHTPHNPPSRLLDKYQHVQDPAQAKYYAMIEWFDETCGALFEKLKSSGVDNNTLVLYLSDNGWNDFGKRTPYENGVRTPIILRWPAKIKPRVESDKLAENIDVFPTLLAAAGVASPNKTPGIDLLNEQALSQRDSIFLANYAHDMESVNEPEKSLISRTCIDGNWKLIDWWPNPPAGAKPKAVAKWQKNPEASAELFDLSQDPYEETNLASMYPERVRQLRAKIDQWWTGKANVQKVNAPKAKTVQKKRQQTEVGEAKNANQATPVDRFKVMKDFKVQLIYSVPGKEQGSWINLCVDNQGYIIASDQYDGLYRFRPPKADQPLDPKDVEKLPLEIRAVNGMVWAFDALYAVVNDYEKKIASGLYRIIDSNADNRLDKVELLREFEPGGHHGLHAILPSADGKSLFMVCGNGVKTTHFEPTSPVPAIWGEDHLLPRMPDGKGHKRDVMAPGGIIYRVSPDGLKFEVYSSGYRNIFDAAINDEGELFTFDADMEYDFNTSWYRPTRVNHVVSGSEYGWRNGAGKRPEFYIDNLPSTINMGPGSPTGMTFGYGGKFPVRYQKALFLLDWSWGRIWAVHLSPDGASYTGVKEEFLSGLPLPVTDAIIHPDDGAMYFTIGGGRVQSGLYRVTYVGKESTDRMPAKSNLVAPTLDQSNAESSQTLRRRLESFHGKQDPLAVSASWPHLSSNDRFIRWAARTAIEHQPLLDWMPRVLTEKIPLAQIEAVLAAARVGGVCPIHRRDESSPIDLKLRDQLLETLLRIDWLKLPLEQQCGYVRTIEVILNRFGTPDRSKLDALVSKLDSAFPSKSFELNWLLCETLVFLQSPTIAEKALLQMSKAPSQEEQIEYARSLRMLTTGWTKDTRSVYLEWFFKAVNFHGGASFDKFIEFIRNDALLTLTDSEKIEFARLVDEKPVRQASAQLAGAMFVGRKENAYQLNELVSMAEQRLLNGGDLTNGILKRDLDNGRRLFGAASCYSCHRFGNEGGANGPDLTSAARRYSIKDLLEQIMDPSKEINDQFVPVEVRTEEGEQYRGIVVNHSGDSLLLNTDAVDPNQRVTIDRKTIISIGPSKVSPMPTGLINMMTHEEILDLLAFILNGGTTSQLP